MEEILEYLLVATLLYISFKVTSAKYRISKSSSVYVLLGVLVYILFKKYMTKRSIKQKEGYENLDQTIQEQIDQINEEIEKKKKDLKEENQEENQEEKEKFKDFILKIIENLNDEKYILDVQNKVNQMTSEERKYYDTGLKIAMAKPELSKKLLLKDIDNFIAIVELSFESPELKDLMIKKDKEINKQTEDLKLKIKQLEKKVNNKVKSQPTFYDKLKEQGKYIDKTGFVRDIPDENDNLYNNSYGDMKYNEMEPREMERRVTPEDDQFRPSNIGMIDFERWRPPKIDLEKKLQHGSNGDSCVCPVQAPGYPVSVLDFSKSRYIMPADNINIPFIKKLNSSEKYD